MKLLQVLVLVLLAVSISIPSCGDEEKRTVDADDTPTSLTGAVRGRSVVLVVADSLHADHLSTYGYGRETSPFVTRLAASGIRAERALSQTSWTLSSVASLFTGLVQERHGVLTADQQLPADGPQTLAEMFREAGYLTVGLVENGVAGKQTGLARGFDRYDYMRFQASRAEELTGEAARLLREAEEPGAPPLFLYLHLLPPHMPYLPPEPFASMFDGGLKSDVLGLIVDVDQVQSKGLPRDHPDVLRLVETYDAHIAYVDDRMRALLEPFREDLCVVFTSDHGEAFMQHGATGHNSFCYDEMVKIPWVIAAPGALPQGVVVPGVTSILDWVPTLAELCDLRLPSSTLDGRSQVPLFESPEVDLATRELYLSSRYPGTGQAAQFALVDGPWKYVTRRRGQGPELFQLDTDPEEQRDQSALHPERYSAMGLRLGEIRTALRAQAGDSLSAPLGETMIRDLRALGYTGDDFQSLIKEEK